MIYVLLNTYNKCIFYLIYFRVLNIYKKIHKFVYAYAFFFTTKFHIDHENQLNLWNSLSETDKQIFKFDIGNLDWNEYMNHFYEGCYRYHLKEDLTIVDAAKKRYAR